MSYVPLRSTAAATAHQREWAQGLRASIAAGGQFAFANADTPQELFHAMGVPVVTNQWWSALIAAKQLSPHYFDRMAAMGFHERLARYSSLPLIAELDGDRTRQPWGGLPRPSILCARQSADDHQRIFSLWAEATGAPLFLFSAPGVPDPQPDWWRRARHDWEALCGSDRLDLMVAEMKMLIGELEAMTGNSFDGERFAGYMAAIERQETAFEAANALVATAARCPVRIAEQIPNVMIPQWHRGSDWAVGHAERFRDELEARVAADVAVCADERVRMMWIGAGLWFDTDFYSAFEESHGAVFAWSMYLPFAADGYIRHDHGDPLRTLAARFVTMNEHLHQPPWVNEWLVHQARHYRIDAALMLVPRHDRPSGYGSMFAKRALEEAGVAVIEVWSDMVDQRDWDRNAVHEQVVRELDRRGLGQRPRAGA
jgi:benzoyl-CoA reductase subunit B